MSNIEKIKAEIERLKVDYLNRSYTFVPATMEQLLDFIDSLPEEKPALTVEDIKTILDISFWNEDPEKILQEYNRLKK